MSKEINEKICTGCKESKPLDQYHRNLANKLGYQPRCKKCIKKYFVEDYYPKNKQKYREANERWRMANWESVKERTYRNLDPVKHKARQAVNNAVGAGKFSKEPCSECDVAKTDFHHTNGYDKENRFTGVWLCTKHHHALHAELRRQYV